jgi:hypothetical protein
VLICYAGFQLVEAPNNPYQVPLDIGAVESVDSLLEHAPK